MPIIFGLVEWNGFDPLLGIDTVRELYELRVLGLFGKKKSMPMFIRRAPAALFAFTFMTTTYIYKRFYHLSNPRGIDLCH